MINFNEIYITYKTIIEGYVKTLISNSLQASKDYTDELLVGGFQDRGKWDASGNVFPSTGGSGTAGAIKARDVWTINAPGALGGYQVIIGDNIRAFSDNPGQDINKWIIIDSGFGYNPLNQEGDDLTGLDGAGKLGFPTQSINPETPISGFNIFANSSGNLSIKKASGTVKDIETLISGKEDSLGFTAENVSNKQSDLTASSTKYPTVNAVNTGLSAKEPTISAATTADYYRGDKTFQPLNKSAVGLNNVDNTSDLNKPISNAIQTALDGKSSTGHSHAISDVSGLQTALDGKQPVNSNLTAEAGLTGAADKISYYTDVGTKSLASLTSFGRSIMAAVDAAAAKTSLSLNNVDNTSDTDKPISSATQTALNLKLSTSATTDSVTEGSTNLYFTSGRALSAAPAETTATIGTLVNGATSKTTPIDADMLAVADSEAGNVVKKLLWSNVKATLKTYFDGLYPSGSGTSTGSNTGDQTNVSGNAGTATTLQTARNIDGQSFNGSANITVIAPGTHAATSKTPPVDADELPLVDSAASNVLKKLTIANLLSFIASYSHTLTNKTITALILSAGGTGAGAAPLKITNGSILNTPEAGVIENDSKVFYQTPTSGNRGLMPAILFQALTSNNAIGDASGAGKPIFNGAGSNGSITLETGTTYEFELQLKVAHGSSTTTKFVQFVVAGGGAMTISYHALTSNAAVGSMSATHQSAQGSNAGTSIQIFTSTAGTGFVSIIKGIIRCTTGGTLTPKYIHGDTQLVTIQADTFMKLTPFGALAAVSSGNWS